MPSQRLGWSRSQNRIITPFQPHTTLTLGAWRFQVWEHEVLGATGDWIPAGLAGDDPVPHYALVGGEKGQGAKTKHDVSLAAAKQGWKWLDDWAVDIMLGMPYQEDRCFNPNANSNANSNS